CEARGFAGPHRLARPAPGVAARHGRGAVRARLPDRLERRAAPAARLLQPCGADRAHDVRRLHRRAADGALERPHPQALLDRANLELALAYVLEILGWADE